MRILLIVIQIVTFFVVTGAAGKASSYLTAKTYSQGGEPAGIFPMVAVRSSGAGSRGTEYRLIRWSELKEARRKEPDLTFKLPASEGRFELPRQGDFLPYVRFKVLESSGTGQLVEVNWLTDDYDIYAKYLANGASVQPRYLRVWGAGSMYVGFIPGLIAAWLLGWLVRRRWPAAQR